MLFVIALVMKPVVLLNIHCPEGEAPSHAGDPLGATLTLTRSIPVLTADVTRQPPNSAGLTVLVAASYCHLAEALVQLLRRKACALSA